MRDRIAALGTLGTWTAVQVFWDGHGSGRYANLSVLR